MSAGGAVISPGTGAQPAPKSLLARIFQRSNLPLLALILLAVLLLVVSALGSRPAEPLPFDLNSTTPTGLRGLDLWLQALGYDVRRVQGMQFALPPDAELLFVYPNQLSYTQEEAAALRAWVSGGRTLVLVGPHPEDIHLEQAFGVRSGPREGFGILERQAQPLVPEGASDYVTEWSMGSEVLDLSAAPAAVPVRTTAEGQVTAAVQPLGEGIVWHLTPGNAFANGGLAEENQGELLPPLLRRVQPDAVVVFDTYHQFGISRVGEQIATLQDWLYRTPPGWATFFTVLTTFVFLVLNGRRLGPSVVTKAERRKREAAEYVEAMASLMRRARLGRNVAQYQQQRLKRGLARRRPLDPNLPDGDFVARLAYAEPPLPPTALHEVRQTLDVLRAEPNEQQLVTAAATIDALLKL
jgi:hypothetical protein